MENEKVILVDENDRAIGEMDKLEAHQKGVLHRAFSVFLFNSAGEMLLQQRSKEKYHSPGLWTNTCCSHPKPDEDTLAAARRRLKEEMGIGIEKLDFKGHLIYKTHPVAIGFENGLTEHEFDHIFTGRTADEPKINPEEVENYRWESITEIKSCLRANPEHYTYWFKVAMDRFF